MFEKLMIGRCVVFITGIVVSCQVGWTQDAQGPTGPSEDNYTLRTYEVGDLVIHIQDYPYRDGRQPALPFGGGGGGMGGGGFGGGGGGGGGGVFSVPDEGGGVGRMLHGQTNRFQLAQFGGGGRGGGGFGNEGATAGSASVTMDDLLRVVTNTVASETWTAGGGKGHVEPLGTTLVVYQVPDVHKVIEHLLNELRRGSAERRTVTIDARWLMLTSDDLESLVLADQKGVPQVDGERLAALTRRPGSIRGITNCLSSQLVYVVSGTNKSFVAGHIPVVGSARRPDHDVQIAGAATEPRIHFVADGTAAAIHRDSSVGYQTITQTVNFGAVLEIRPTLVPLTQPEASAVVDLKSTVTVEGDEVEGAGVDAGSSEGLAPAVDRVAIETQEFATTLRVPLGKPVLVGGMTSIPSASGEAAKPQAGGGKAGAAAERPQLYLVLEVR